MKLNWGLFRSIIEAYRTGEITRNQFVYEYGRAQRLHSGQQIKRPGRRRGIRMDEFERAMKLMDEAISQIEEINKELRKEFQKLIGTKSDAPQDHAGKSEGPAPRDESREAAEIRELLEEGKLSNGIARIAESALKNKDSNTLYWVLKKYKEGPQ